MSSISPVQPRFGAIHVIGQQTLEKYKQVQAFGNREAAKRVSNPDTFQIFMYSVTGDNEFLTSEGPIQFNGPFTLSKGVPGQSKEPEYVLTDTDSDDRSTFENDSLFAPATMEKLKARINGGNSRVLTYA